MESKDGTFVWVESRGRLHVESGKCRKAVILSGRIRPMPKLTWGSLSQIGGLAIPAPSVKGDPAASTSSREFWGIANRDGTFLFVGASVRDLLGWSVAESSGKSSPGYEAYVDPRSTGRPVDKFQIHSTM